MTRELWIKNIAIAVFLLAAFAYFYGPAKAQVVESFRIERFATSTMSIAQQEEVVLWESKMDVLIQEQKITNRLLTAIYEKI